MMKKKLVLFLSIVCFSLISHSVNAYMPVKNVIQEPSATIMPWGPSEEDQNREYAYDIRMQFKDSDVNLCLGAMYKIELARFDCIRKGWAIGVYKEKELNKMTESGMITYVSNDPEIAKVSSKGVITANRKGETVIDIYYREAPQLESGDDGYAKTSIAVNVTKNNVSLSKRNLKIKIGKKRTLKLKKYPDNVINKTTYKVSKKHIVKIKKVSENCLEIIGKKKGSIVLSINVLSRKFKCRIYVK